MNKLNELGSILLSIFFGTVLEALSYFLIVTLAAYLPAGPKYFLENTWSIVISIVLTAGLFILLYRIKSLKFDAWNFAVFTIFSILTGLFFLFSLHPHSTSTYRNGRRLVIVSQLISSLELYSNDTGRYPDSLNDLLPTYIGKLGQFPVFDIKRPACPVDEPYKYEPKDEYQDFVITFCLPERDGRYKEGYHVFTKNGIQ